MTYSTVKCRDLGKTSIVADSLEWYRNLQLCEHFHCQQKHRQWHSQVSRVGWRRHHSWLQWSSYPTYRVAYSIHSIPLLGGLKHSQVVMNNLLSYGKQEISSSKRNQKIKKIHSAKKNIQIYEHMWSSNGISKAETKAWKKCIGIIVSKWLPLRENIKNILSFRGNTHTNPFSLCLCSRPITYMHQ